jgi:mRNA interferase RelE/StbE
VLNPNLSKQSAKFLSRLSKGQPKHAKQIAMKLVELVSNPRPHDCAELKGYDYLRVDVGEYRIIYTFDDTTLFVDLIGKRNDDEIYEILQRKS